MEMRQWAVQLTAQIRKHVINMQDVALNRFGELRILTEERKLPAMEGLLRIPAQLPLEATTNDMRKLEANAVKLTENFLQNVLRICLRLRMLAERGEPVDVQSAI